MNVKSKLEKAGLLNKSGNLSHFVRSWMLVDLFENKGKIRLVKTSGSYSRKKYVECPEAKHTLAVVEALGYKVTYGNDAPRGGKLGDYATVRQNKTIINKLVDAGLVVRPETYPAVKNTEVKKVVHTKKTYTVEEANELGFQTIKQMFPHLNAEERCTTGRIMYNRLKKNGTPILFGVEEDGYICNAYMLGDDE